VRRTPDWRTRSERRELDSSLAARILLRTPRDRVSEEFARYSVPTRLGEGVLRRRGAMGERERIVNALVTSPGASDEQLAETTSLALELVARLRKKCEREADDQRASRASLSDGIREALARGEELSGLRLLFAQAHGLVPKPPQPGGTEHA
jgi:hypothetical protein